MATKDPFKTKKPSTNKSKLKTIEAKAEINSAVDSFLKAKQDESEAKSRKDVAAATLKGFYKATSFKAKEMEGINVVGSIGTVRLIQQDVYRATEDGIEALEEYVSEKKWDLDVQGHIEEVSEVSFNFNKMTEGEQAKLVEFLMGSLGQDRVDELFVKSTKYKISGISKKLLAFSKTQEEYETTCKMVGFQEPTVSMGK